MLTIELVDNQARCLMFTLVLSTWRTPTSEIRQVTTTNGLKQETPEAMNHTCTAFRSSIRSGVTGDQPGSKVGERRPKSREAPMSLSIRTSVPFSALQEPRTNTSKTLFGSGWVVRAMVEKKESQQHKRKRGYGGEEGGSRESFLGQVQVHKAWASPGHLAWLYLIIHHGLPIFFRILPPL